MKPTIDDLRATRFATKCPPLAWLRGSAEDRRLLSAWPLPRQTNRTRHVNEPLTDAELAAVRRSIDRGCPYGSEAWCQRAVSNLNLETTLRPRGRPKNKIIGS
jgi:putative transposase